MEKRWFTAPAPRNCRAALTVAGSVGLHGAIIAVAALWPMRSTAPAKEVPPTAIFIDEPAGDPEPPTLENQLVPAAVPSDPPPVAADAPVDPPPTPEEPSMELAVPPRPVVKTAEKKARSARPVPPGVSARNTQPAAATVSGAGRPGAVGRWHTPQPLYPYALRAARIAGSGSVRVTTDGSGRVMSASVVQSTGNSLLDENTCVFARHSWTGPPNAAVTVPITYQMR